MGGVKGYPQLLQYLRGFFGVFYHRVAGIEKPPCGGVPRTCAFCSSIGSVASYSLPCDDPFRTYVDVACNLL